MNTASKVEPKPAPTSAPADATSTATAPIVEDEILAFVTRTTAASGVDLLLEDPTVINTIVRLVQS
jgi:hypothetical protein